MLNRRRFLKTAATGAAALSLASRAAEQTVPKLPFALFDTHAHLVSADQVRYPRALPNADVTASLGAQAPDVEKLLGWMDDNNVAGAVGVQRREVYGYNNYYLLDSTDRFRSRLMPLAALDATDEATPELMRQHIRERGLAGLRLNGALAADGSLPWLSSPAALNSWAVAEEHSLAIAVMTSPRIRLPAAITEYMRLARQFPSVRLVLDHVGWPDARGAPEYGIDAVHRNLALFTNIHFKFSSVNLQQLASVRVSAAEVMRRLVDVFSADRVMWGSDIGNSAGNYADLVRGAIGATALLTADEQRKVLRDTGMRVFIRGGLRRD